MDVTDDALAAALEELRLRCVPLRAAAAAGGDWRRAFPLNDVSLHVVVGGDCLIATPAPLWRRRLRTGEVLLVNRGVQGELRSTGGDHRPPAVVSMRVQLDAPHGHPLIDALPQVIRANPTSVPRSFGPAMQTLVEELSIPVVGQAALVARLCEVLFIQALRMHLGDISWDDRGWFRALADPVLQEHMHLATATATRISDLSRAAHRSTRRLRARFLQASGSRPAKFVRDARVRRAAALLREGLSDLERIATLTGYGSRQALARAFRGRFGVSPTEYWRQVQSRPFPKARGGRDSHASRSSGPSSSGRRDPAQP